MMKLKNCFFAVLLIGAFSSCSKDNEIAPIPKVSFAVELPGQKIDSAASITWPTWINMFFVNYSDDGGKYHWDFGNGETSDLDKPAINYVNSGDYEVTLTVTKNGQTNIARKKVKIVERQVEAITVKSLKWDAGFRTTLNWPQDKTADIFFRIYEANNGVGFPSTTDQGYQDVKLIYESPVKAGIKPADCPFTLPVQPDLILQHSGAAPKYAYCLYAKDGGQEYLLLSNWGFLLEDTFFEDYTTQKSTLDIGFRGTAFRLNGLYK